LQVVLINNREKEKEKCDKEHEKYKNELTVLTNERIQLEQTAKSLSGIFIHIYGNLYRQT